MEDIFIVGAARTAIGKFGGSLAGTPATKLGAHVIAEAHLDGMYTTGDSRADVSEAVCVKVHSTRRCQHGG